MAEPVNIGQVAYLLQHVADLRKMSRLTLLTLAASSLGAALTAYAMVTPVSWPLVAVAFAGAFASNLVHAMQTSPTDAPVIAAAKDYAQTPFLRVEPTSLTVLKNSAQDVFGVKEK